MSRFLLASMLAVLCGAPWMPGAAQTVQIYRCVGADGAVSYQDKACAAHQRQSTMQLSDAPQVSSVPDSAASSAAAADTAPPPAPVRPPEPPTPLPTMYACHRYDDSRKHYLNDTLPLPYAVPLGAMGFPSQSLDRAYGGRDRLGLSAPEEARAPKTGGPLIANATVLVQDPCRPATHGEVCGELRHRYDANHEKLRMAFPSDQPPLEQREAQLRGQLDQC